MKTPAVVRPSTWEPRQRLVALIAAGVLVVAVVLWAVLGADGRRAAAACDLFTEQEGPLRDLLVQVEDAAAASEAAGDTTLLTYFDNADSSLNTMRRWQATQPRVALELDGSSPQTQADLTALTEAVAELQRLVEADVATEAVAYLPDVEARLDDTAARCD